jgi:tetratricopeptide (TPR) repeat protein
LRSPVRAALLAGLAVAALYSGYRIVAHTAADAVAAEDPAQALRRIPGHPAALLARAERELAAGDTAAAVETVGRLRQAAPLQGGAWRILAQVEAAAGNQVQARELFAKAVALGPRDVAARAWLADDLLVQGKFADALVHIDRIMTTSPHSQQALLGVLVQLSADPAFVDALTPVLARQPGWRSAYLHELQRSAAPDSTSRVMAALARDGGLTPAEDARWIDDLMRRGQWGQAYAHWAGTLAADAVLSPVFNDGFDAVPTGAGFDWRTSSIPGQTVTFEQDVPGASGHAAALEFRGRPASRIGLEQALLLAPGNHELRVRMRAEGLRSDGGLEWVVACADAPQRILGRSPRIAGSFDWETATARIEVPADCPGQWLRLRNPGPTERSQWTEGRLWVDQVRIGPGQVTATPEIAPGTPSG